MPKQEPSIWICSHCRTVMPRAQAEALSTRPVQGDAEQCRKCGAVGKFVEQLSPEGADIINDLRFPVWAASLKAAGYDVVAYSESCDRGDHKKCNGKNRMNSGQPKFDSCGCECHMEETIAPGHSRP